VGGDTFSGGLTRQAGENVSTYAIQQGTLALSGNYTLTYVGANLTITQANSTTTVSSSSSTSVYGQSVTFTATVTSGSGTPTGTVTFLDGSTILGTGTLDATGKATFTTSGLAVANHSITAVYGGSSNFTGSTSVALTQTVNKANTKMAVTS